MRFDVCVYIQGAYNKVYSNEDAFKCWDWLKEHRRPRFDYYIKEEEHNVTIKII